MIRSFVRSYHSSFLSPLATFVACLLLIPLKMAATAPRDNVMAANANNGGGGANAAVIGGDAAAPFPLAAGAGRGPVPGGRGGGCGGGRGGGAGRGGGCAAAHAPGRAAAHPGSGPRFTTAELEHLNESVESVLPLGPMEWEEVAELHVELYPTLIVAVPTQTSKSQLLWDPLFTPDLSTFLIGKIKLKLS
jgi:hypothetical protein